MIIALNDKLKESEHYKPEPKEELITRLANIEYSYPDKKDYSKKLKTQSLFYVEDNFVGEYSHKNYLEYLLGAWDAHWGIVVSPDILWYTLQCELTGLVSANSETYRSLFTTSNKKEDIIIGSSSFTKMPLDDLFQAVSKKVPSDINAFLPSFSTTNRRALMARYAAFLDMVSPYYNYMMYSCGFPAIDVRGDETDWKKLRESWKSIGALFTKHQDYVARVDAVLEKAAVSLDDADFWRDMFSLERCGSGHQYLVNGWINDLFTETPRLRKVCNYPSHVSTVAYKQLNTKKNYEMKQGLISSKKDGAFLVPEFGHVIYEKKEPVSELIN